MEFSNVSEQGAAQPDESRRWQLRVVRHRLLRLIPCISALALTVGWGLVPQWGIESRQFSAELLVGESASFPATADSQGQGLRYRSDLELNARVLTPDPGRFAEILSIGDSLRVTINPAGQLLVQGAGFTLLPYALAPSKKPYELGVYLTGKRLWVEIDDVLVMSNYGNTSVVLDETTVVGPRAITGGLIDYDLILSPYAATESATDTIIWIGLAGGIVGALAWVVNGWASANAPRVVAGVEGRFLKCTATVVAVTSVVTAVGYLLGSFPYPFAKPEVRFSDLLQVLIMGQSDPYSVFESNYPPAGLVLLGLATKLPDPLVITLTMSISLGLLVGLLSASTRVGIRWWGFWPALVLSMSFPVLFALDRGNLEIAVVSYVGIGIVALLRGQWLIAACALSLSIAIKVYPVALLPALWRARSNRRAILGSLLAAGAMTVIAGISLGITPLESMFGWGGGDTSSLGLQERMSWGMSLTTGILVFGNYFLPSVIEIVDLDCWLGGPQVRLASWVMLGALATWTIVFERVLWRGLAIMALGIILLQPVSFQYRAVLLLLPIIFISRSPNSVHRPVLIGVLMGILLSPVGWIRLGLGPFDTVTIASVIHPATALALLFVLLGNRRTPTRNHRKSQVGA